MPSRDQHGPHAHTERGLPRPRYERDRERGGRRLLLRLGEEADDAMSRWLRGRSRYEIWFGEQQASGTHETLDPDGPNPQISIIMPVCDPDPRWLHAAIDSVRAQHYPHWQLCMVDDASTHAEVVKILRDAATSDERIQIRSNDTRQGIARTSNRALALAQGEYVALLDHDDELTPDALVHVVKSTEGASFDILYTDEDKLDPRGRLRDPTFKPGRCRDLLYASMYFGHLTVYRTEFIRILGGFDPEYDGSQDYELALRAEAKADRVVHLSRVLYHWRMAEGSAADPNQDAKPWAYAAGRRAIEAAVRRESDQARVVDGVGRGHARVVRAPKESDRVSVLYCVCCGLPEESVEGGFARGGAAPAVEWIPIAAGSGCSRTSSRKRMEAVSIGQRWNDAAAAADGELLIFLDGVRPKAARDGVSWIGELASQLQRLSVGGVGTRITSRDGKLLHIGAVLGGEELIRTRPPGLLREDPGHLGLALSLREVSAVTGGSFAVRRSTLTELGGFDPGFEEGLHDVDLCLRLRSRRERVLYDPYVDCEKTDSHSGAPEVIMDLLAGTLLSDLDLLKSKWASELAREDRFSNMSFQGEGAILHPGFRTRL